MSDDHEPPTVRVGRRGWTWPSLSDKQRQIQERNERKRLIKLRRKRDKNAGRK